MPEVGFESTITASERAKTVHASDRVATVTGHIYCYGPENKATSLTYKAAVGKKSRLHAVNSIRQLRYCVILNFRHYMEVNVSFTLRPLYPRREGETFR
jgi:hypothetical protein